jgi:hypothetical protein
MTAEPFELKGGVVKIKIVFPVQGSKGNADSQTYPVHYPRKANSCVSSLLLLPPLSNILFIHSFIHSFIILSPYSCEKAVFLSKYVSPF